MGIFDSIFGSDDGADKPSDSSLRQVFDMARDGLIQRDELKLIERDPELRRAAEYMIDNPEAANPDGYSDSMTEREEQFAVSALKNSGFTP